MSWFAIGFIGGIVVIVVLVIALPYWIDLR